MAVALRLEKGGRGSHTTPTVPKPRLTPLPCAVPRSHEGQYLEGFEAADSSENRFVVREHSKRHRHALRFERNT